MAGEMLADDNSPMIMTVGQYNDRVAYTWKLATEAEQERIVKLLEGRTNDSGSVLDETGNSIADLSDLIELVKGETK